MTELTVIRKAEPAHSSGEEGGMVRLLAPRATLAKRRWRGVAEDGREVGFDLETPLLHGSRFRIGPAKIYQLEQMPEEVLEVPVQTLEEAARIAWSLGNLHFGVQVLSDTVRVTEDPAVLQLLQREGIAFRRVQCVFLPLGAGASHHHSHAHAHE
jgi:urease accessory protein